MIIQHFGQKSPQQTDTPMCTWKADYDSVWENQGAKRSALDLYATLPVQLKG